MRDESTNGSGLFTICEREYLNVVTVCSLATIEKGGGREIFHSDTNVVCSTNVVRVHPHNMWAMQQIIFY